MLLLHLYPTRCRICIPSLPYLCKHVEQIQRRTMRIIFRTKSYAEAFLHSKLLTLEERRRRTCDKLFKEIVADPNHKLQPLLPELNTGTTYSLRTSRTFNHPKYKTDRFRNTLIIAASLNYCYNFKGVFYTLVNLTFVIQL